MSSEWEAKEERDKKHEELLDVLDRIATSLEKLVKNGVYTAPRYPTGPR